MANHMANQSRVRRMLILFLLAFGTTAMYSLPYLKSSFYDPMQQALGLTHIEIGNLLSLYGLIGMFSYFFGGWVCGPFFTAQPDHLLADRLRVTGILVRDLPVV